jgi:hypothetical protein
MQNKNTYGVTYCTLFLSSNLTEFPCSITSQGLGKRDEDTSLETGNAIIC